MMQSDQERQHLYGVAAHTRQRAEFLQRQVAAQLRQLAGHQVRLATVMEALRQTRRASHGQRGGGEDPGRRALCKLLGYLRIAPV